MTSFEIRKLMKPWMMKDECVSPQCYLPMMQMIGFGSLLFFARLLILIRGISMFPFELPMVSNLMNLNAITIKDNPLSKTLGESLSDVKR